MKVYGTNTNKRDMGKAFEFTTSNGRAQARVVAPHESSKIRAQVAWEGGTFGSTLLMERSQAIALIAALTAAIESREPRSWDDVSDHGLGEPAAVEQPERVPGPRPLSDGEFDLTAVCDDLWRSYGVRAYVDMTGGGTATIYAGEQFTFSTRDGDEQQRWEVAAGPGFFRGPNYTYGTGYTDEFYVGADDDGESGEYASMPMDFDPEQAHAWAVETILSFIAKRRLTLDDDDNVPAWVRRFGLDENQIGGE